ncbi:TPA: hypothetical protein PL523_004352 [Cronobacter turicensis]|nr:hypothetical protein [Cronobacter turicensis]HDI3035708.1 hypothetical protein [Cronobacter turicensis]
MNSKEYTAIDATFGVRKLPVYVVCRHGRSRRFLSRSSALNNLVHFMVQFVFDKRGIPTHENGYERLNTESQVTEFSRGELTGRYWDAHHRTHRRLMRLLARKREILKWRKKYDAWVARYDELMATRPY